MTRRRKVLLLGIVLAALVGIAGFRLRGWVAQDACLDAGGAWHDGACRHGADVPPRSAPGLSAG
ncbi:MAG: hypothetical protein PGN34_00255 [Methylobacterium frigidaeris]